jgi:TonB family protein
MRKLFFIASLLACLMSVNAFAQDKPTAPTTVTVTEQPKNVVERAVEEAKERGEKVVGACLVDCRDDANSQGAGETGRVVDLPKPEYPPIARAAHATGTVEVQVLIDFDGNVVAAASISGHPLLQGAAVSAARKARFTPLTYNGEPVKMVGVIQYNFVIQ